MPNRRHRIARAGLMLLLGVGVLGASPDARAEAPGPFHRTLPKMTLPHGEDAYPPPAKRLGLEGVVSIAFNIDPEGHVREPTLLYSDAKVFSEAVERLLRGARFAVPADWHETRQDLGRYTLSVRFELEPCGHLAYFELTDSTVDVCGSRIPGSTPHQATEGLTSHTLDPAPKS